MNGRGPIELNGRISEDHGDGRREVGGEERLVRSERWLTVSEVADILQIHANTVRHWADWGYLASFRIGPRQDRRFRYEDVIEHLPRVRTA